LAAAFNGCSKPLVTQPQNTRFPACFNEFIGTSTLPDTSAHSPKNSVGLGALRRPRPRRSGRNECGEHSLSPFLGQCADAPRSTLKWLLISASYTTDNETIPQLLALGRPRLPLAAASRFFIFPSSFCLPQPAPPLIWPQEKSIVTIR